LAVADKTAPNVIGYPLATTTGLWTFPGFWALSTFLSEL